MTIEVPHPIRDGNGATVGQKVLRVEGGRRIFITMREERDGKEAASITMRLTREEAIAIARYLLAAAEGASEGEGVSLE